ncbi:hypothetical protein WJX74_005248 [Apatococcus lobatus]|uniref:Protein kinase domain-containing protein n=1 Tax=Apatococcus lobatus TaxID=904363 RepID=A0AAW1RPF9_9CHLO
MKPWKQLGGCPVWKLACCVGVPATAISLESHTCRQENNEPATDMSLESYTCRQKNNEPASMRLKALQDLAVHSEVKNDQLDRLCMLFATYLEASTAMVTIYTADMIHVKSAHGLDEHHPRSYPLGESLGMYATDGTHPRMIVVPDALQDKRFNERSYMQPDNPAFRFFISVPILTSQHVQIGALTAYGKKVKTVDASQCIVIRNMAALALDLMSQEGRELSRADLVEKKPQSSGASSTSEAYIILESHQHDPTLHVLVASHACCNALGMTEDEVIGCRLEDFITPADTGSSGQAESGWKSICQRDMPTEATFNVMRLHGPDQEPLQMHIIAISRRLLRQSFPTINLPSSVVAFPWESSPRATYWCATFCRMEDKADCPRPSTCDLEEVPFTELSVGHLIGSGSYGKVYTGTFKEQPVAVKVTDWLSSNSDIKLNKEGIPVEVELASSLRHDHVVYIHASHTRKMGELEGNSSVKIMQTWLVMEHCDQGSLSEAFESGRFQIGRSKGAKADMKIVLELARQMADALAYVHSKGIVHGDLKGGNVLLSSSSKVPGGVAVKLADFGLSRICTSKNIDTKSTGTITHAAPERMTDGLLSKAADVYSFGVICWELWNGKHAWSGMIPYQIMCAILRGKQLQMPTDAPPAFASFVATCLAREPHARPTFAEAIQIIASLQREQTAATEGSLVASPFEPPHHSASLMVTKA